MKYTLPVLILVTFILTGITTNAQSDGNTEESSLNSELFDDIKLRNIGPAFMSGRVADIAIDPRNESIWYVAIGSGGVWKTENAGTTFKPVFDEYGVYSTGCISIDPSNPHRIWLGTGENVGGRHVSFGDGIYKSDNGGISWTNMGLQESEHISKIIIHPDNPEVIWVATQGPLWSEGGQRGVYKSKDGGQSWERIMGNDQWMGATDIIMDPRNPDRLYAATWAKHRTVAAVMDGSELSRIYKSEDGGESWVKLEKGLPEGKWGKIGLALSPIQPDVIYAAIELNRRTGGVWRSEDRGGSWTKMSDAVAGATGPHYYQEIFACPHTFDRLYLMNNRLMRSDDGGKNFYNVNEKDKHGDNHSVTFKASDPDYLLVGTDGGVYESFDLGKTWRYMENIPVTQFYKLAVDDAEPFYNIYGGTQDNSTEGGPSRTDNLHGIRNADWKVVLNWDGHQPATEPGNPDIIYAERQEGNLSRIDMITGEVTDIQPQAAPGEDYERFNWDAPILVSPHSPTRLYFASQRVWRSENRGDSWQAVSGDLTKNEQRLDLPIMGQKQSWDSPWDVLAMSNYNTITSLAESPVQENLLYAGTDDGLLNVTVDGGENWKTIEVAEMGVPATCFINDVKADLFDASTVYVALDNHKYGDYKPYLVKSTDKGQSWTDISGELPDKHLVWRLVQDHEDKDLLFAGTEFGLFVTVNGGENWIELNGGIPTISFKDLAIQRRENDLVAASFGRGFFILDDYSALREIDNSTLDKEAELYTPRKAWWHIPRSVLDFDDKRGSQGSQHYVAPNPEFGAVFTYYLKDKYESLEEQRKEQEKSPEADVSFPGWEAVEAEAREDKPLVFLQVTKENGEVVNRIKASNKKGFQRVSWDLRRASQSLLAGASQSDTDGPLVVPGRYYGQLFKNLNGVITAITDKVPVDVVPLRKGALEGSDHETLENFWNDYATLKARASLMSTRLSRQMDNARKIQEAAMRSNVSVDLMSELKEVKTSLDEIDKAWNGLKSKNQIGEKNLPTANERLFALQRGLERSTYGPTETHTKLLAWVKEELDSTESQLIILKNDLEALYNNVLEAGGPLIEGMGY